MSVLRNLESKLAGLVEGTFSRAFKSEVRPVEIARKLAREMERAQGPVAVAHLRARTSTPSGSRRRTASSSRATRTSCARELSGYLLEHARRERLALVTPPADRVPDRRARCGSGEFGIQARLVRPRRGGRREHPSQGDEGHTMVYSAAERVSEPLREPDPRRGTRAAARRRPHRACSAPAAPCSGARATADVVLDDPNVSRRHAEVRPSGGSWIVRDLGSTNGVKVNGRRIQRRAVAQARRRDRARHLARRPSSWSSAVTALDPVAVAPQVRLPRRAVPVPALGGALGAQGPAPRRATTAAPARPTTRTPPACTSPPRASAATATSARRGCGWRPRPGCAPASAYDLSRRRAARPRRAGRHPARGRLRLLAATRGSSRRGMSIVLEDLGSTNGTYLNGEPLRGPQPLHAGDKIRIGDSEFTFER